METKEFNKIIGTPVDAYFVPIAPEEVVEEDDTDDLQKTSRDREGAIETQDSRDADPALP